MEKQMPPLISCHDISWDTSSTREGLLVVVSIYTLNSFMIGVVEGYLVGLSLVILLRAPLKYPNLRAVVHFFCIYGCNYPWHVSWKSSCITS